MATKLVKQQAEDFAKIFRNREYFNKLLQIIVSESNIKPFTSKLLSVRPATLQMMKGLEPEKRRKGEKEVTPATLLVEFEDGNLFFIMDDIIKVSEDLSGLTFHFRTYTVSFKEVL